MTSNLHPIFEDILRRCQRNYDRQEPEVEDETIDESELERREAEYREWIGEVRHHLTLPKKE